ncbi:MAG: hypothetical protein PHR45_08690 [Muribaculaceae bacterium]|nr:hypothetical protein [Muribaculaceae bacterium]
MTHLQKFYFRTALACIVIIGFGACSQASPTEGKEIVNKIENLQATDFASFPSVIEDYNTYADSLLAIDPKLSEALDNYIVKNIDNKCDTIRIAAYITIYNPIKVGIHIVDLISQYAQDKNLTVEQRCAKSMNEILVARFLYMKTGETSSIGEMEKSIEDYIRKMDTATRAKLYTAVSAPSYLAIAISRDSCYNQSDSLITEIRNIYKNDEQLLDKFNDSLNK